MSRFDQLPTGIREELRKIEPDFEFIASVGPELFPALFELLEGGDDLMARRAVYTAGMVGTEEAGALIAQAAADPRPTVRVAAAGALRHLVRPSGLDAEFLPLVDDVLGELLRDPDPSVRRWSAKTVGLVGGAERLLPCLQTWRETTRRSRSRKPPHEPSEATRTKRASVTTPLTVRSALARPAAGPQAAGCAPGRSRRRSPGWPASTRPAP
jgi:hypothetical protein